MSLIRYVPGLVVASLVTLPAATSRAATVTNWEAFVVTQTTDPEDPHTDTSITVEGGVIDTLIDEKREKTAFSTRDFDGKSLSTIGGFSYTLLSEGKRPYVNIWVNNGVDQQALVVLPENLFTTPKFGDDWKGLSFSLYEVDPDKSLDWVHPDAVKGKNSGITLGDIGHLRVGDILGEADFIAVHAPRSFGFNIVFGDSGTGYNQDHPYRISDVTVTVIPTPATAGVAIVGLGALLLRGRRSCDR